MSNMSEKKIYLGEDLTTIIKNYVYKRFMIHEQEGVTTSSYGVLIAKESSDFFHPIGIYIPKSNARREGKESWVNDLFTGRGFEDKKRGFCMDAEEQIQLFCSLEEKGEKIVGIFHAHPDLPERYAGVSFTPTLFDIKFHYEEPSVWCMIAFMKKNQEVDLHTFDIHKKTESFEEIPLQILKSQDAQEWTVKEIVSGFYYTNPA